MIWQYDEGMQVTLVLLLALWGIASAADLEKEALGSVEQAFKQKDASLDWFRVASKTSIDPVNSVMIVQGAPRALQKVGPKYQEQLLPVPQKTEDGVFLVSGPGNRVRLVLDVFPLSDAKGDPSIGETGNNSINLHFYSDYGMYTGSIKYIYDLASGKPTVRLHYKMVGLGRSAVRGGMIVYTGQDHQITIEPRNGAAPSYRIVPVSTPESDALPQPVSYRLADRTNVKVVDTPVGSSHQPAGFSVGGRFFPVPVPTMALHRKMRPDNQAPGEIENDIGPSLLAGGTVWFTNSFYDGEGTSGVGALGSFDVRTHKYEMRYLPEIAHWSGSAIRIDGDSIWIGLMRQPEGAAYGGGLLRYDTKTGAVTKYPVSDFISTIDRLGDAIYCGTSNGVYVIRGDAVTQLRFEPDASGKTVMISSRK